MRQNYDNSFKEMFARKSVFITGANGGIGKEIVDRIARCGGKITLQSRSKPESHRSMDYIEMDFTNLKSLGSLVRHSMHHLDIMIHNAGLMSGFSTVHDIHCVNCIAPLVTTLFLLPNVLQAQTPQIIVVSSSSHLRSHTYKDGDMRKYMKDRSISFKTSLQAYAVSKYNIMLLTAALKQRLDGCQCKILTVHPGLVDTPMLQGAMGKSGFPGRNYLFLHPFEGAMKVLQASAAAAAAVTDTPAADANVDYYVNGKLAPWYTARGLRYGNSVQKNDILSKANSCFKDCLLEVPDSVRRELVHVLEEGGRQQQELRVNSGGCGGGGGGGACRSSEELLIHTRRQLALASLADEIKMTLGDD